MKCIITLNAPICSVQEAKRFPGYGTRMKSLIGIKNIPPRAILEGIKPITKEA